MDLRTPASRIGPGLELPTARGYDVRVLNWRGEGSYARVYRALYSRTGAPCALKLAKMEIPEAGERLEREAGVLARVEHLQVAALLDRGRREETPFLVLEWLEGDTLLDLVAARKRLPLRQALDLAANLLDGLASLHEHGLSHGDLRPQNVIVVPGRGAVLTDPDGGAADPEADVRAAGALLYRMLTGEDPARTPARLTAAAGHNPQVVALWERGAASHPPSARELLEQARRLRASL